MGLGGAPSPASSRATLYADPIRRSSPIHRGRSPRPLCTHGPNCRGCEVRLPEESVYVPIGILRAVFGLSRAGAYRLAHLVGAERFGLRSVRVPLKAIGEEIGHDAVIAVAAAMRVQLREPPPPKPKTMGDAFRGLSDAQRETLRQRIARARGLHAATGAPTTSTPMVTSSDPEAAGTSETTFGVVASSADPSRSGTSETTIPVAATPGSTPRP